MRANAGDLEHEDTIIIKEVVDLTEEALVATNADVLHRIISKTCVIINDRLHAPQPSPS